VWHFRSLRVRLTLWYVLLLAVILAAFSAGIYLTLRHNLNANLDESLQSRVDDLLALVSYEGDRPTLLGSVSSSSGEPDEQFARAYDASGNLTFDSISWTGNASVDTQSVQRALAGEKSTHDTTIGGEPFRVRFLPIERAGAVTGVLEVGKASDDVSDTLEILVIILAIAYPLTLVVASGGGLFLASRALGPIAGVTRLAREISSEDLSRRLDLRLPDDEVGRLARTFDEMIERLEDAFRRQRQFTADASHELRTPLTAMKGQLEVALARPRDAGSYREVLEVVNAELDRLIRLVGSLLSLSRADSGQFHLARESGVLAELVSGAAEALRPTADEKGVSLAVISGDPVTVQGDEDALLQLLLNLLDNALKYTETGGRVELGWKANTSEAEIWVRDSGIGIAEEHLSRIFDRFYRVDEARSRAAGGAGLGLSISRWIAGAHGGSISVESAFGGGSIFTIRLPLEIHKG